MGLWTKEEISGDIAGDALNALAKRLMGNLETRLGTIAAVKAELVAQLDAYAAAQAPDPPASADGNKGWMLCERKGIALVNPIIFLQLMLKDYPHRKNFTIYAQTPWDKKNYTYKGTAMAWAFNLYEDKRGHTCLFSCLGIHRCAPGDIVISDDARYVVDTVKWNEDSTTWDVRAHAPSNNSAAARFDPHANDPKPRPCGDAALKVT